MRIATAAELREADRQAIDDLGIPGACLMQSAGEALARACAGAQRIAFLCGKGNNGGDGFAAARLLAVAGKEITVLLTTSEEEITGLAATHLAPLRASGVTVAPFSDAALAGHDLLVDCLLGTGTRGAPRGLVAEAIRAANASGIPLVACDLPSGVDADTGEVPGDAIRARATVTLSALKPGLLLYPGAELVGELTLAPIGLPILTPPTQELTTIGWVRATLPKRQQGRDANKGAFGTVLVVAGARGMAGAAVLTATAALRAGAGLVYLAVPESLVATVAALSAEVVVRPLPETPDGTHGGEGALETLLPLVARADAIALGPGLTAGAAVQDFVEALLTHTNLPLVIDADGLNCIAQRAALLSRLSGRERVLTPHPGELGRLLGLPTRAVQASRTEVVGRVAQNFGSVTLLKGARTLVASPAGQLYYNREGSVSLATAGSGDVLTGVIAALLAQGLTAENAARCGAYWHALAGESLPVGSLAGEIRDALPAARLRLESGDIGDL
ncbi:NAD(P)H-hydrate dehydratase [Armatimonas rosea]|uniref:Bifunctional NAD(P)H-hydrate repair enzyme n=1 Tax=Armatimonas rosea TaxID=685828 RepID=A0A7W9W9X5_ARMRO|nr:NAD(P)H-hydrate dehydratase [Armatimonas rosea]MBB6053761.1 NAD(P)H-hydrate epimerase [Armatimonas rosea]